MIRDVNLKKWFKNCKDPQRNEITKILGVEYAHMSLENGDDLYVTKYGLPFIENLQPDQFWTDKEWFRKHSKRLLGTSSVYKVRTKQVKGKCKDIVVKWNRMGQEIPGADECDELMYAEFNSPFEEFALVYELRDAMHFRHTKTVIQKPFAIYVPSEMAALWQTGRAEHKMQNKIDSHKEVRLDMRRSYAVIYEWMKGIDAAEAFTQQIFHEHHVKSLTLKAAEKMMDKGFVVRDNKPQHVIVRPKKNKKILEGKDGKALCGLIDFELLERTPEKEEMVCESKRAEYLKRQRDRFSVDLPSKFHPHLHHVDILDVEYIYGHVESTKGRLWVVGRDPFLFDYFLPEKWASIPKTKISVFSQIYYAVTKDNIHLVWEISKVGLQPDMDPFKSDEKKILEYGHNSPFEEVALAVELNYKGIPTTYPRAIYMSEHETNIDENLLDESRYESHKNKKTPDGEPILKKKRDYVIIWGYWNGPDEKLAVQDGDYYEGIHALRAYKEKIITEKMYVDLLQTTRKKLLNVGVEDLNLRGNHILLSFDSKKNLVKNQDGTPDIRICNFDFLKKKD